MAASIALLAPFALVFSNFGRAVDRLVQEQNEEERFAYFRHEFARFYLRCRVVAEHLAEHVAVATGTKEERGARQAREEAGVAWRLLRALWGDENAGTTPWEVDSGQPPQVTWEPQPTGGAFARHAELTRQGVHRPARAYPCPKRRLRHRVPGSKDRSRRWARRRLSGNGDAGWTPS